MIQDFIKKENITLGNIINPIFMLKLMRKYRYLHFFIIGVSGVAINLLIVYLLTEFIFGVDKYFYGYLCGLAFNLLYLFILNSKITFKTKSNHLRRFGYFVAYHVAMSSIQALLISTITPILGRKYYLFIIGIIIFIFSLFSYFVFKLSIFKEKVAL